MQYDFLVVGAGIAGCSVAHFLNKEYKVAIIDKNAIASGASGAAGAFLSPLLGKPNPFKELVNDALVFSSEYYKKNYPDSIDQCGVLRVAQDSDDIERFISYKPYIDFEYQEKSIKGQLAYFFPIGAVVNSKEITKSLVDGIDFYQKELKSLQKDGEYYICDDIKAKNIVLCTGVDEVVDEEYLQIRAVWGQRIDIETTTQVDTNIHKNNSISRSKNGKISIGATHHIGKKTNNISKEDSQKLINMSKELIDIDEYKIVDEFGGARACSVDYFPIVGEIIDSKSAIKEFPYLKNGTNVKSERIPKYDNVYIINGVGGRGYVLSPYIAKLFVDYIKDKQTLHKKLLLDRLFIKWVRKN